MCVHWIMRYLNYVCTIFGTMPFSMSRNPDAVRLRFRPLKMAWTFFLTLWTFGNIAVTPFFFNTKKMGQNNSSTPEGVPLFTPGNQSLVDFYTTESVSHGLTFLKMLNPWLIFLMSLASHYVTIFRLRTQLPAFLEDFAFIDSRLAQLTKTVPESSNYALGFFALTAFPVPVLGFYLYTVKNEDGKKFLWCVFQVFSNLVSYSCELQFLMLCYAVGARFKTINQFFPVRSSRDLIHQTWLHPRDPIFGQTAKLTAPVVQLALDCYLKLCRLISLLNEIYSVQILFSMSGCFVKALLNVYFAFFGVHNSSQGDLLNGRQMDVIKTALWTVYYGMRFFSHAIAATITVDQAARTKIVISSLYSRHLDAPVKESVSPSSLTYTMILVTLTFCNMVFTTFRIISETTKRYAEAAATPSDSRNDCNTAKDQSPYQSVVLQVINAQVLIFMSLGSHWVSVCRLVPKLPLLIDYIVSIDRKLPLPNSGSRLNGTYFSLGIKFCLLLAATTPAFLFYVGLHSQDKQLWWFVTLIFHNLVSYSCELQLLVFFLFIKSRFRIINDVLSLRNRENDSRMKSLSTKKILVPSFEERHLLKHVDLIHESYLKLCDSWVILNDIYSVQVLFSTSGCFLKALFNVYILMSSNTDTIDKRILNSLMWMVFYFYRFIFLAAVATSTAEEANKTKGIIAYMSCFYFEKCIKEELDVFWVNASCRELEFSTCGLFKLNSGLITKACVTGITYLVLLVQFNPQIGLV